MASRQLRADFAMVVVGAWVVTIAATLPATADPSMTPAEDQFVSHLLQPTMVHPPLTPPALVVLGHQACSDISGGVSPDLERDSLDLALVRQGVASDLASIGTRALRPKRFMPKCP